jgi:hypothetical protein
MSVTMEWFLSKETAHRIWSAHREIETATQLIVEMRETIARDSPATPLDRGGQRFLQLGVPSGTGHRLFGVQPELAIAVIEAHVAAMREELAKASNIARMELAGYVGATSEAPDNPATDVEHR